MIDPKIVTYIKTQLHAGAREQDISSALALQGWSALDIAKSFDAARESSPSTDKVSPLAYERLHPTVGGTGSMPQGMSQVAPTTYYGVQAVLFSKSLIAAVLTLATLGIMFLIYKGVQLYITAEMITSSSMLLSRTIDAIEMGNFMLILYFFPLPMCILALLFICRYKGIRIATHEARPYLGYAYANTLYFLSVFALFAVTKVALSAYLTTVPTDARSSIEVLYTSYYFAAAGLFGVGLVLLAILLTIVLSTSLFERIEKINVLEIVLRYLLISVSLAAALYMTNVLYKPALAFKSEKLCSAVYDVSLRFDCESRVAK